MTIIQPNRTASFRLNWLIAALILVLVALSISLVSIYNRIVNLEHGTAAMRAEIHEIQTASAELKEQIFSQLDSRGFEDIVAEKGLVKDRAPQYLEVDTQWSSLATRY